MKNGLIIDQYGNKFWYKDDQLHREDGPAEEWADGYKAWYLNDKQHREDGPAGEYPDGLKYWCYHDRYMGRSDQGMTNEKFLKLIKLRAFF